MICGVCCVCRFIIYPGRGSLLVKNNMQILWFCRSKCRKFFKKDKKIGIASKNFNRKRLKIEKNFFLLKTVVTCEKFIKYNRYLILHILYQFERFKKVAKNKQLSYIYYNLK